MHQETDVAIVGQYLSDTLLPHARSNINPLDYFSLGKIIFHLQNMLRECVAPEADRLADGFNNPSSPAYKMSSALEKGLGYQYQASWMFVLQVIQVFFEV